MATGSPKSRRLTRLALVAMAAIALGVGSWAWLNGKFDGLLPKLTETAAAPSGGRQSGGDGPAPVETVQTRRQTLTTDLEAIGSLQSDEFVAVAPEIAGRVLEIAFEEGQPVKKGQIIVKLDDAIAAAELAQSKANLKLAAANNDRTRRLTRSGTVAQRTRDEVVAAYDVAVAAVELGQIRVDRHIIRAPFDGVAGMRNISVGAFINVGTSIVNIEKTDQLKADFRIPELFMTAMQIGQSITVKVDALQGQSFNGTVYAIDPSVDVNGRSLLVRAKLPNPDGKLRPGLFARITIKGSNERNAVVVPESAIVPKAGETFVYRIEDGKAQEVAVELGQRKDGQVEIVRGLDDSITVVVAGQQRLRNGAAVEIVTPQSAEDTPTNVPVTANRS